MKEDILNGAGAAYDTLKEVGVLIEENKDAIEALETIAGVQADWNQSDENAKDYIKNKPSLDKYATTSQLSSLQTQVSGKMQQNNPWGSGSFSLNGSNSIGERAVEVNNHNTASGADSFAQGSSTTAWGVASHSEGSATIARGAGSHAEGYFSKTKADAKGSHAEGEYVTASVPFQHAEGRANVEDDDGVYAHIVGNGTDDENRSNAYALDWQGNGWFAGDVYVGSASGVDKDEGSKKLATEEFVDELIAAIPTGEPVIDITDKISGFSFDFSTVDTGLYWSSSALGINIGGTFVSGLFVVLKMSDTVANVWAVHTGTRFDCDSGVIKSVRTTLMTDLEYYDLTTTSKQILGAINELDSELSSYAHVVSDITEIQSALDTKAPAYTYSATDLTAGTSSLETGKMYLVYE